MELAEISIEFINNFCGVPAMGWMGAGLGAEEEVNSTRSQLRMLASGIRKMLRKPSSHTWGN